MLRPILAALTGLTLAGCVTAPAAPAGSMATADCKAMMDKMQKDGGQMPTMSPEMMKKCPMMQGHGQPEKSDAKPPGSAPDHQH